MTIARHLRLTGRVQGVFFRGWTRQQAQDLGVAGWVRNCSDRSVEAHLEGEDDAVDQLIDRMREGPKLAQVDKVQVSEAEHQGVDGFEVRR